MSRQQPPTRILVVEGEDGERARLEAVLGEDYLVTVAITERDAGRLMAACEFDLVLVGCVGERGEDEGFLSQLRRLTTRPKVILLTPAWCSAALLRASELGADGVLEAGDTGVLAASVAAHLRS